MDHIREYILSVTTAALLCGVVQSFVGEKGSTAGILRLICGIYLSFTVIRPLVDIELKEITWLTSEIMLDADAAVEEGEDYAVRARARLIKEQAEAYILDKAQAFNADIEADVILSTDDPPVPVSVIIRGSLSPYVKQQLKAILESDLGICEEDQQWIP